MGSMVILMLVLGYSFYLIWRKSQKIKRGEFCSCGCSSCSHPCGQQDHQTVIRCGNQNNEERKEN